MTPKVLPEALIEELLACPLCGWKAECLPDDEATETVAKHIATAGQRYSVLCTNLACRCGQYGFDTVERAVKAWNRRSPPSRVLQDEGVVAWRWTTWPHADVDGDEWPWTLTDSRSTIPSYATVQPLYAAPPAILPSTIGGSVGVSREDRQFAITAAAQAFCNRGISIACPWEGDLDDEERERFDALVAAIDAYNGTIALSPAISGEPTGWQPIETAELANEMWEIAFGATRDAVPDGLTDELLTTIAAGLLKGYHISRGQP